jgi:hypothetical protein
MSMLVIPRPAWLFLAIPFAAEAVVGVRLDRSFIAGSPCHCAGGGFRAFRTGVWMLVVATSAGGILGLVIGMAIAMKPHP